MPRTRQRIQKRGLSLGLALYSNSNKRSKHTGDEDENDEFSGEACVAAFLALPHFSRYSPTDTETISMSHPIAAYLKQRVESNVTRHRRHKKEDPKQAPMLRVTRVQEIRAPRLQQKYLAEVQDIAGLCGQKVKEELEDKLDALRVQSFRGLSLNEVSV